jgi:F0F1-type ATP synthase membrane subunit b/b'
MLKNVLSLLLLLIGLTTWAQPPTDKAALEQERKEIQRELNEIQQLFDQVKSQKKQTKIFKCNMLLVMLVFHKCWSL